MSFRSKVEDKDNYLNREISLLAFNRRVLDQARDTSVPLLERMRFLAISSNNLDEFFEVRVAGLKQQLAYGLPQTSPDGRTPSEALRLISKEAHSLVRDQYRVLNELVLPELEDEGIRVVRRKSWNKPLRAWAREYFREQVMPVLSPIGLDPAHPFPKTLNKALNFVVTMSGIDAFGRSSGVAIVRVPRSLPRLIRVPKEICTVEHELILLSSIIHAHIGDVFPGMDVDGCFQFRVTRNSDMWVDEEEVDDLLSALKDELQGRHYGDSVRLEVADNCTEEMERFLLEQFHLSEHDLYRVDGPVNLNRLMALPGLVDRPDLRYTPFVPKQAAYTLAPLTLADDDSLIFDALRKSDRLLHHPFDSFGTVIDLVRAAARDDDVVAIKQTLYRTGEDSEIVALLIEAARAGKEVAVVIELKARFDEAANIALATALQDAGVNVIYGLVGHKTHAKMLLVVRREGGVLKRYAHIGTGNYHSGTARLYTDIGLMTSDEKTTTDIEDLFKLLTGLGEVPKLKTLTHAPFTLHKDLVARCRKEAENARELSKRKKTVPHDERPRIIAKMNSLTEPKIIQELYKASIAGVEIDLIVRGVCCLRPGVAGVSENIRVRSIVGRFLEHSRVWYFYAGGKEDMLIASADWMDRNFFKRVEAAAPVRDPRLKERLFREVFSCYLEDNQNAWLLQSDGTYKRLEAKNKAPTSAAQEILMRSVGKLAAS